MKKLKVALIWQGFSGRYGQWQDGLYAAMKLLEQEHEVKYFDFPLKDIHEFKPDIVLYWEAPVTNKGRDADNWFSVCALPYKKALLFAGGPLKAIDVKDFDLVFVESLINEEDCEREGIPYKRAFGVNTQIMKPIDTPKLYDGFMQATFADWKRHTLFAQALGDKGAVAGRKQEHDLNGYNECVKRKVTIFDEQPAEEVAKLINQSYAVVNTSEYWGGGQRCTLEAMACGVPVIVMADSPKNREFVEESNGGLVVVPDEVQIRAAVAHLKNAPRVKIDGLGLTNVGMCGYQYVKRYWSEFEYRDSLLEGINSIV